MNTLKTVRVNTNYMDTCKCRETGVGGADGTLFDNCLPSNQG